VTFVPDVFTGADVYMLLPPFVAVFPLIVTPELVPSSARLPPPTPIAPPRFPAEFEVNEEVATVVGMPSFRIAPPDADVAWLLENVDVAKLTDPLPIPPGDANARIVTSAAPPPEPVDAAVLLLNVVPVTVNVPVPPVCMGEEGV
jgi:hypothetical protein